MWDWVGGRTSELGPVGLLPGALQGADIRALLAGAKAMDARHPRPPAGKKSRRADRPAWYFLTDGRGAQGHGHPAL